MRKIILDLAVSLDGFIEGRNGEIDWCIMDDDMEFDKFLDGIDTIFYGRVSYEQWGNFRPDPSADSDEQVFWDRIHRKKKYCFSREHQPEGNAVLIQTDLMRRVSEIKAQKGKDIWLYGGADLIRSFIQLGLIDTYRIAIHPVALGSGKPLFEHLKYRLNFQLQDTRVFRSGVVQLIYQNKEGPVRFYHGTKAGLKVGDLLKPGFNSNYGTGRKASYVYLSGMLDAAIWGAELAAGEGHGKVFRVEPTGPIEDDPNLTDQKFPGNPTRSYRTMQPLRILEEVEGWQPHSAGQIAAMKENLERLRQLGIEAIE